MFVWIINVRQDDVSEGIDVNKTNTSKECDICHFSYILVKVFKYEPHIYNGCHHLMQKSMNFNDVATVSVKWSNYRIHFYMSKNDAVI